MGKIEDLVRKNKNVIIAVFGAILICILLLGAIQMVWSNQAGDSASDSFNSLATPTAFGEARIMATPALVQTPMPTTISSAEWKVSKILEPVKIGQFTYAIVEFKNIGNGETKTGQCQMPAWDLPAVDTIYILKNTYISYWLFIPLNQREETESQMPLQHFAPID